MDTFRYWAEQNEKRRQQAIPAPDPKPARAHRTCQRAKRPSPDLTRGLPPVAQTTDQWPAPKVTRGQRRRAVQHNAGKTPARRDETPYQQEPESFWPERNQRADRNGCGMVFSGCGCLVFMVACCCLTLWLAFGR